MVQPLCSALHDLCRRLELPPTSDQGLEGTLGVTGGLEDTRYSARLGECGVVIAEDDLAASERAGELEQVPQREQTGSGTPPSAAGGWSHADPEQGQSAVFS